MKTTFGILCLLLLALAAWTSEAAVSGDCPASSRVTSCSPKCLQDAECSAMGGRCCPNLCNHKSCVRPGAAGGGNNKGSGAFGGGSGGSSTATGTYCGNTKCNSGEKCELDRTTKRQKCVRG